MLKFPWLLLYPLPGPHPAQESRFAAQRTPASTKQVPFKAMRPDSVNRRKETMKCVRCHSAKIRRSHRRNLLERLLSTLGIRPFRCDDCGHRFRRIG